MRNALNPVCLNFDYLTSVISFHNLLLKLDFYQKLDKYILSEFLSISLHDSKIVLSYLKTRDDYPYKQHLGD